MVINHLKFHELLEKLISTSNIKKIALAEHLNYDISYISKWSSGKALPSKKNLHLISTMISEFIVSNISIKSKDLLIGLFDTNDSSLENCIKIGLIDAYYLSIGHGLNIESNNSIVEINTVLPVHLDHYLTKEIKKLSPENLEIDLLCSSDMFYMRNKKLYYYIQKDIYELTKDYNISCKALVSSTYLYKDLYYNLIILSYMILSFPKLTFDIHITKNAMYNEVVCLKNHYAKINNYLNDNKYLLTTNIYDIDSVNNIFNVHSNLINSNSNIVSEKYFLDSNSIYNIFFLDDSFKFIISDINELFIPKDLFDKLSNNNPNYEILYNRINNTVSYDDVKILITKDSIIDYLSNGKIHFFNNVCYLDLEDRINHLRNILNLLKQDNIKIKFVDNTYFKNNFNVFGLSTYISDVHVIIKSLESSDNVSFNILDSFIKKGFNDLFDSTFNDSELIVEDDKNKIIKFISKVINK